MGKQLEKISSKLKEFIEKQPIFFVGTARTTGKINVSPKGMDSLRIIDPNRVVWLNLTGSGNETAAHLLESDRMTIMFCAFDGNPLILRLYGTAAAYHERDAVFQEHINLFPKHMGSRQIIDMKVEMVQTSCGFAVPLMEFQEERTILKDWAEKKGEDGIREYWQNRNSISLDGHETGI